MCVDHMSKVDSDKQGEDEKEKECEIDKPSKILTDLLNTILHVFEMSCFTILLSHTLTSLSTDFVKVCTICQFFHLRIVSVSG